MLTYSPHKVLDCNLMSLFWQVSINGRKCDVESQLAVVAPIIEAARLAVGQIKSDHLNEIRSLKAPPDAIRDVLEGVLKLMGQADTSWNSMKKFLGNRGIKVVPAAILHHPKLSGWMLGSLFCQLVHWVLAYMATCLKGLAESGNAHRHVGCQFWLKMKAKESCQHLCLDCCVSPSLCCLHGADADSVAAERDHRVRCSPHHT